MVPAARLNPGLAAAVLAGGAAGAWYAALLLARDAALLTPGYDLAFFQQLVWGLDHGRWFESSFSPGSFLALHFEPALVIPAALELAWPDPRALSLLAALALAALGPAAYLFLATLTGRPAMSAALAAPLPLLPAVQEAARAGFHTEYLGADLALGAGAAALRGRGGLATALALLALSTREDAAWGVFAVGLAAALRPETRALGGRLVVLALAWAATVVGIVMPALRRGLHLDTDSYYGWLRHADAGAIAHALLAPGGWLAMLVLLAGLAFLPLLRPGWLLLAAPPLLADLLSSHDQQPPLHLQYAVPLLVPLVVAAGQAVPRLDGVRPAAVVAIPALLTALFLGSLPPALGADATPFRQASQLDRLARCTRSLPAAAAVAADDDLLARLADRARLHELDRAAAADHLVVDRNPTHPGYVVEPARDRAAAAAGRPLLCASGRFLVYGPAAEP